MSKRYSDCNGPFYTSSDEPHCTKKHNGIEMHIVFTKDKMRDEIMDKLIKFLQENLTKKDVGLAYVAKVSGELQNAIHESFCEGGDEKFKEGTIYEREGDFGKEFLK